MCYILQQSHGASEMTSDWHVESGKNVIKFYTLIV